MKCETKVWEELLCKWRMLLFNSSLDCSWTLLPSMLFGCNSSPFSGILVFLLDMELGYSAHLAATFRGRALEVLQAPPCGESLDNIFHIGPEQFFPHPLAMTGSLEE